MDQFTANGLLLSMQFAVKLLCMWKIIFSTMLLTGCSSLLYYPSRVKYVDTERLKVKPEELRFRDADGLELAGWYFRAPKYDNKKPVILFFHGNGQNLSAHFYSLYWILEHGYDFFIFDYAGYGLSEGDPSPANTVQAGHAALRWLKEVRKVERLTIFGQSLGGAVALKVVIEDKKQTPFCLVTVDSTFSTYQGVAADALSNQWWSWPLQPLAYLTLSDKYAPYKRVSEIAPIPLVVIHGDQDPLVNIKRGQQIYDFAGEPKEFWSVAGGGHIDAFTGESRMVFQSRYLAALKKYCGE